MTGECEAFFLKGKSCHMVADKDATIKNSSLPNNFFVKMKESQTLTKEPVLATTEKVSEKDNKNVDDDDENDSKTSDNNDDDKKNSDDDSNSDNINDDDSRTTDGDDGKTSDGKDSDKTND